MKFLKFYHIAVVSFVLCLTQFSSFALAETTTQPETATKESILIAHIIAAYGGNDNLAKLQNIYSRGYQTIYQADNDGWITSHWQRPDKLRIETALHQVNGTALLIGERAWMATGKEPFTSADKAAQEWIVFQFNCMNLPLSLAEGKWTLSNLGKEKSSSSTNEVVLLKNSAGQELTIKVGEQSHLITMVSGSISRNQDKVIISHEYQDYREVGGIKFPFKVISYYDSIPYAVNTLSEVRVNMEMPPQLFQR
jgi:hypothetical protein